MKEATKETYEELKRAAQVGLSFNVNKKKSTIQVQHIYWKRNEDRRHD